MNGEVAGKTLDCWLIQSRAASEESDPALDDHEEGDTVRLHEVRNEVDDEIIHWKSNEVTQVGWCWTIEA